MDKINVFYSIDDFIVVLDKVIKLGLKDAEENNKADRTGRELAQRFCSQWNTPQEKTFRFAWKAGRLHLEIQKDGSV